MYETFKYLALALLDLVLAIAAKIISFPRCLAFGKIFYFLKGLALGIYIFI